jgi:cytochrome P450 family 709
VYWTGAKPNVCMADVSVVMQVLADRTGLYPKNVINPHIARLLGKGLVLTDGDEWKRHRKVVHPVFNMDKIKMMTATMSDCARSMMSHWEAEPGQGRCRRGAVEVDLGGHFEELTAAVILHTAFGSSYIEGKKVFLAQRELQFLAFSTIFDVQVPILRYLPTEKNLKTWALDRKVRAMLMSIIKSRFANKDVDGYGNDLLGLMLEACERSLSVGEQSAPALSMDEIIDECKTRRRTCSPGPRSCSPRTRSGRSGSGRRRCATSAAARSPPATRSTSSGSSTCSSSRRCGCTPPCR